MVWPGLGVNYQGAQPVWESDMAYFREIGVSNIRVTLSTVPQPWNPNSLAQDRETAQAFAQAGFWVTWGPSANVPLTSTTWPNYAAAVIAEAQYDQAYGLTIGDFELGNELEENIDNTTITQTDLISLLSTLAYDVKQVYNLSPISYGCFDKSSTFFNLWVSKGTLGNLDTLSIHGYPNNNITGQYTNTVTYSGNTKNMQNIVNAFPGKIYCSEFGLDSGNVTNQELNYEQQVKSMRTYYTFMKNLVPKAFIFQWADTREYAGNGFTMKNDDGSFNPQWDVLLTDNKRRTFTP